MVGLLAFALPALAGIGGSAVPDYTSPITVGQTGVVANLTITNASTNSNSTSTVAVTDISTTPSCGSSSSNPCTGANIDTGVFTVHNGIGRAGTACAGVAFTAGAPDSSGKVIFTPGSSIVLGPSNPGGPAAQCIIDFTVDVLKLPTIDSSIAPGIQTTQLGFSTFQDQTTLGFGTGSGSSEVTVNKVSPSISTTLSATSTLVGGSVHDSAALASSTPNAGGTVTYTVYTDGACSLGAQSGGTKTVTNGIVPDSNSIVFNSVGTFNWQAVYSGDANNNAATSTCQTETLVVNKVSPSISTTLSATSTPIGGSVHDSAALSGATSNAGGTVTYTVYNDAACSAGAQSAGIKAVTNGVVTDSNSIVFNTPGTFNWQAVYSGDAGNNAATSTCQTETLVVNKVSPSITTNLSATTTSVGGSVHDSATLTGATPTAGGSVTYTVYNDNACSAGAQSGGTKTVTNGIIPDSNSIVFNSVGTFNWQAVYSGDSGNNAATSTCQTETMTVTQPKGHIIVDKITFPSGDSQSFNFTASGTGYANFSLTDAAAPNNQELNPGTYSVGETLPAGWVQTSAVCDGGNTPANISLAGGQTVTCTFTNTKGGHLIVDKVTNPSGSTVEFPITASGSGTITGGGAGTTTDAINKTYDVTPGTYSVAETLPANWNQTSNTCSDVVVGPGETKTCVITNTQVALQYCSPGYWKNHSSSWVTYSPSQLFSSVFEQISVLWSSKGKPAPVANPTLQQALEANGGGLNQLARATVNALLNTSAGLNTGFTTTQIINMFNATVPGSDSAYSSLAAQFTAPENCPLN